MSSLLLLPALLALPGEAFQAEVIDRTAAVVDRQVITASAIEEQLRVTAFLNGEKPDLSAANRRRTAERLVEQTLLRREMELTRYQPPQPSEIEPLLRQVKSGRPEFEGDLAAYGLTEAALRRGLLWQLTVMRFIELRFRPGSAVSEGEVELYYREEYVPEWMRAHTGNGEPPDLEQAREKIEAELIGRKVDQALDSRLKQARSLARVRFIDEAFEEQKP
jgi:hypothetical protein